MGREGHNDLFLQILFFRVCVCDGFDIQGSNAYKAAGSFVTSGHRSGHPNFSLTVHTAACKIHNTNLTMLWCTVGFLLR